MSTEIQANGSSNLGTAIERVLIGGDLSALTSDQRTSYYRAVCESVGLNPLTKPFDYIELNRKLVLYAKKDATDQLRKIHGVSVYQLTKELVGDIVVVTANGRDKTGREDSATGAVSIASLRGDALANAYMKAETKAKRRLTLSICGLGMLDETELETIPQKGPTIEQKAEYASRLGLESLPRIMPEQPPAGDGQVGTDYRIPFGKWKARGLDEVVRNHGVDELISYIEWLEAQATKAGKPMRPEVIDFISRSEHLIASIENGPLTDGEDEPS